MLISDNNRNFHVYYYLFILQNYSNLPLNCFVIEIFHNHRAPLTMAYELRMRYQHLAFTMLILATLLALGSLSSASAQIFICQTDAGKVFQDQACKEETAPTQTSSSLPAAQHATGIDESWLEAPSKSNDSAFCNRRICECGNIRTDHTHNLPQALSDALYLDVTWHRYQRRHKQWNDAPAYTSPSFEAEELVIEAACEVMISQVLIRKYFSTVVRTLSQRALAAEEYGFDEEQPCLQGVADACDYYESVVLLQRIQEDAASLRHPRSSKLN